MLGQVRESILGFHLHPSFFSPPSSSVRDPMCIDARTSKITFSVAMISSALLALRGIQKKDPLDLV